MRWRRKIIVVAALTVLVAGSMAGASWYREYRLYQLLEAVGAGERERAVQLLGSGAPVNGRFGGDGDTPLHRAAAAGAADVVQLLLANGAATNAVNDQGSTPLLFASYRGNLEAVRMLLHAGADPNLPESRFGTTPLMEAARRGYAEVVRLLLAHGANPGLTDRSGETALAKARRKGNQDTVATLSERGK